MTGGECKGFPAEKLRKGDTLMKFPERRGH